MHTCSGSMPKINEIMCWYLCWYNIELFFINCFKSRGYLKCASPASAPNLNIKPLKAVFVP
ncbi:protein of unknown function [Citrobacter amalonaticus]|uniref:Uncharacterized protein n=1 Tax=Citrobacter amalonaticus TaxID=35703 RepID=A0AAX2BDA5_CITAM|nr:protein of unknown function [Citrobacter amalonaticus]SAZ15075.1 protein of unknown function [Citrobacter amalonaticus]